MHPTLARLLFSGWFAASISAALPGEAQPRHRSVEAPRGGGPPPNRSDAGAAITRPSGTVDPNGFHAIMSAPSGAAPGGSGPPQGERAPLGTLRASSYIEGDAGSGELSIGSADLLGLLRERVPALRGCADVSPSGRHLGPDRVLLRFVLSSRGEVLHPEVRGPRVPPELVRCITDRLVAMRFPPPSMGTLPVEHLLDLVVAPPAPATAPSLRRVAPGVVHLRRRPSSVQPPRPPPAGH